MIKDTRYIIKRVIIGVLICLILSFIKTCEVHALTNYTQSVDINMNESSNNLNRVIWNDPNHTSKIFASQGRGTLVTIILTDRYSETTSFELPTLYSVNARTDSGYSTCEVSSLSNDTNANTQMKASMYGVKCDITMGSNGLISLSANFDPQVNNNWNMRVYRITFNNNLQAQEVAYEEYMYQYLQDWIYPRLNDIKNNTTNIYNTDRAIYNYIVDWLYPRVDEIKQALLNTQQAVVNGNAQAHSDAQAQQQATEDINDSINNSNVSIDTLPSDNLNLGPISALVTLPITALNNIVNAFSGTCTPFNIGSLFGTNLVFPCINIESFIGSFLWNTIDIIITGIYIFGIRQKFVDLFYKLVTLKDIGLKGGF